MKAILLFTFVSLITSCGKQSSTPVEVNTFQTTSLIDSLLKTPSKVTFHVYYHSGAEPYTGLNKRGKSVWTLFQDNVNKVYSLRPTGAASIVLPTTLDQMKVLPTSTTTSWSAEAINTLANQVRDYDLNNKEAHFQLLFLKGYYQGDKSIIGVNLNGTAIIAIFKDVVSSSGTTPGDMVCRYVEQSSLIHEFGHAIGLVSNGLPITSSHLDGEHVGHCSNPDCVMYWSNEGTADLVNFVNKVLTSNSDLAFDQACIQDIQKYTEK